MTGIVELIKPYIEDKIVLNIGCGTHKDKRMPYEEWQEKWTHNKIKRYSKYVFGIDIDEKGIEFLKERGYNVEVGNAENFNLNKKFDVITSIEVIEHLSNFQGFFDSIKRHLKKEGLVILTTPNAFNFKDLLLLILRGYPVVHLEHTCWFDEVTIRQLLNRFNFSIEKIMYTTEPKIEKMVLRLIQKFMPYKLKHTNLIVIAKMSRSYENGSCKGREGVCAVCGPRRAIY